MGRSSPKKDGHGAVGDIFEILCINDSDIASAIENARVKARDLVWTLGMSELNGYLINPPVPLLLKEQDVVGDDDDDDDDVDEECVHKITPDLLQECLSEQNEADFSNSISKLTEAGIIEKDFHAHLTNLQQLSVSKSPSTEVMPPPFMETTAP